MAVAVTSELQGTIVGVFVERGTAVDRGHVLALIESMKMHHEVVAPQAGTVDEVLAAVGSAVVVGERLIILDESVRPDGEVPATRRARPSGPVMARRASTSRWRSAPTSPRSSSGTNEGSTRTGRRRSSGDGNGDDGRLARTSPTLSTTARSSSTDHS